MSVVQEIADECVRDDCGYDEALPQHVASFLLEVRDKEYYQDILEDFLTESGVLHNLMPEIMRDDAASAQTIIAALRTNRNAYLGTELVDQVEKAIDAKMNGWYSEPEDLVDEFGGAL